MPGRFKRYTSNGAFQLYNVLNRTLENKPIRSNYFYRLQYISGQRQNKRRGLSLTVTSAQLNYNSYRSRFKDMPTHKQTSQTSLNIRIQHAEQINFLTTVAAS